MRGKPLDNIAPGVNKLHQLSLINCGLCIDTNAFKQNGGYNEKLALDFSDHDFIRRFKNKITDEFVLIDLTVRHDLSSRSKNSLANDLGRFDYYLMGTNNMTATALEKGLLKFNAIMRAMKLLLTHRNVSFIGKLFTKKTNSN